MDYECLIHNATGKFCTAQLKGHAWYENEREEFTIIEVEITPDIKDFDVELVSLAWGVITVKASQIDVNLTRNLFGIGI